MPYFLPFSHRSWTWSGQWALNSWQNFAITVVLLLMTFWLAWVRGYSALEMVSEKADAAFVGVLRRRVARPSQ